MNFAGITFEWSITLGTMVHLATLLFFLWWFDKKAMAKLNKIHRDTSDIMKSLPPTTTK